MQKTVLFIVVLLNLQIQAQEFNTYDVNGSYDLPLQRIEQAGGYFFLGHDMIDASYRVSHIYRDSCVHKVENVIIEGADQSYIPSFNFIE